MVLRRKRESIAVVRQDRLEDEPSVSDIEKAEHRGRELSPAARRALAEARERRRLADETAARIAETREIDGRGGAEPVRFGDWEVKGLATDF